MLNTNRKQRDKKARKDEKEKIALELLLFVLLQKEFRKYSKAYKLALAVGAIAPTIELQLALEDILKDHYKTVADKFSSQIIAELGIPHNHDEVRKLVDSQIEIHSEIRAQNSAKIIANTTHRNALAAVESVRSEAIEREEELTAARIAARAQLLLDRKLAARIPLISNVETQNAAEHAKQTEIDAIHDTDAEINDVVISSRRKFKEWQAILDNHTREWHAEADGQIVPFDEPFVVNGENLMYPGDISLGASGDNIFECRCAFIVIIR